MINSMTGFARLENKNAQMGLTCEMRSINHRYLEISLHLPEILRPFEMAIRELIRQYLKRGKVECSIRYQSKVTDEENLFTLNQNLAKELVNTSQIISGWLNQATTISVTDIMRFPGVLESKEKDFEDLKNLALLLTENTLKELVASRDREGKELENIFFQKMELIETELDKVKQRLPMMLQDARERLLKRFSELKMELDTSRLEQEMIFFAQKIDVAEEVERLATHVNEIRRVIKTGGTVGRRLDFLSQELNREANTLGSKSIDSVITYAAVEMKVLIEQVREQVQNVE